MTAAAVEPLYGHLPGTPESVRDDPSLRIMRTPRTPIEAVPEPSPPPDADAQGGVAMSYDH